MTFRLFEGDSVDPTAELLITPEYDFKDSGKKIESRIRVRDGGEFVYKWGSFDTIKFTVKYVNDAFKTQINNWWVTNTDLKFQEFSTPWITSNAAYDNKLYALGIEELNPNAMYFRPDGLAFFTTGSSENKVHKYELTTAWDIGTAVYNTDTADVSAQEGDTRGVFFSTDGLSMYIIGVNNKTVYQYTLSVAWDLSTSTYASKSILVSSEDLSPQDVYFRSDGLKMFIAGTGTAAIYSYVLTTAWDISTATYDGTSLSVLSYEVSVSSMAFDNSGTILLVMGSAGKDVNQFTLTSAWNLDSATFDTNALSVASEEAFPTGLAYDGTGDKLFVVGINDNVHQYGLTTNQTIQTVKLSNKKRPVDKFIPPYINLHIGKIELSTPNA